MKQLQKDAKGFTLIELSIVIVIIGLIVAGVTAGQSLVRQARLKAVINQVTEIKTALNTFRLQYNEKAGDMRNAYNYWGTIGNCTNADVNVGAHDGCNGNGDGNLGPGQANYQAYMIWKHLNLAKLLPGQYSGVIGSMVTGLDLPAGPLPKSIFYAAYDGFYGVTSTQDMISFGTNSGGGVNYAAVLSPSEAQAIDSKADDGHPIKGRVFSGTAPSGATGDCINGGAPSEGTINATAYVLNNTAIACRMIFNLY